MALGPASMLLAGALAIGLQHLLTEHKALTQQLIPEVSTAELTAAFARLQQWSGLTAQAPATYRKAGQDIASEAQPDEVRQRDAPVSKTDPTMRCFEALPPWSMVAVHGIEIYVESFFQQKYEGGYAFKYHVEFTNTGTDTVQMLTRHWIFTDADGNVHEVKGPGAVGVTPTLEPGGKWEYDSGTSIATPIGSVAGSFQFEILEERSGLHNGERNFNARVGRLALTEERRPVQVPCGVEAPPSLLPTTSVHSTRRVIVGATTEWLQPSADQTDFAGKPIKGAAQHHVFKYDVQINNARDHETARVVDMYWEFTDATGGMTVHTGAATPGGKPPTLQPGGAYRGPYAMGTITIGSSTGTAEGFILVQLLDTRGSIPNSTLMRARIGRLALSRSGQPVHAIDPDPPRLRQGRKAAKMIDEPLE